MNTKFNTITFENPRHTRAFRELLHVFFEVPISVAINKAAVFNTEFIGKFNPVQVYAVSEQMTTDGCLVYQIVKPELFKLTGAVLQMLFAPINMQGTNYLVKAHNIRAYVELQDTTGDIVHPTEQRSLKALHTGGRDGALSWEQLVEAVGVYELQSIILDTEIEAYKEANGYNVEAQI